MDFSAPEQREKFITVGDGERDVVVTGRWSKRDESKQLSTISEFRKVLPQILAVSNINLILLDLGMVLAFPTIVIPDLLKSNTDLKFTEEQASWFGSIAFICQPLGSLFSGFLFDPVGRKRTMFYVNIPLLLGWLLIYFATSIAYLYIGGIIMGIGIGFMDAPHITYLGEITLPKWRGILTSYAELCVALGFSFVYFLGTAADWRTVSVVCAVVPILTMIFITQIPESPIWLLSKGKKEEAEKSLCWLRGWVKPKDVQKELSDLIRHSNATNGEKENSITEKHSLNVGRQNFGRKVFKKIGVDCLFKKSVFRPLVLVVVYFGFSHVAGVTPTRPFMVDILEEFGTPLNAKWVTAISSVIGMAGFISGMILLPKTGKRSLSLVSMFGCSLTCGLMAVYGFFFTHLKTPLVLVFLFVLLNFIWSIGIGQIPWMLISEVFPFKGRGIASGISAALSYIQAFVFTKTYYAAYNSFTLYGIFGFYGVCSFVGGLYLYYNLPETEGRTLEQIESIVENHFSKNKKDCRNNNV